jgi:hypothetical protein
MKKLRLSKETLVSLNNDEANQVAGGFVTQFCPRTVVICPVPTLINCPTRFCPPQTFACPTLGGCPSFGACPSIACTTGGTGTGTGPIGF